MSMSSTIAEVAFYIIYGKDGDGMAPTAFGTAMVEPIRGIRAVRDLCQKSEAYLPLQGRYVYVG